MEYKIHEPLDNNLGLAGVLFCWLINMILSITLIFVVKKLQVDFFDDTKILAMYL